MKRIALAAALVVAFASVALANPDRWRRAGWQTDFSIASVDLGEIFSGGPPRDGIPSIDDPKFRPASEIDDIGDNEPVIQLEVSGIVRAYPLRVLTWHEIVNDTIAGRPVAVTYCPLCNSAIVFDRTVKGEPVEFGVSGLLRNSDMVMYDRATQSWWQQFTGEGIVGVNTGEKLTMIPSRVESLAEFRADNPEAEVLVPTNPRRRAYGYNPYVAYDSRDTPYPLYRGDLPEALPAMARVIVVRDGEAIHAVTLAHLREQGSITVGHVALSWQAGVNSALDGSEIRSGRDVGAVEAKDSATGAPVVHDVTFAFVVQAFHPGIAVETASGPVELTND